MVIPELHYCQSHSNNLMSACFFSVPQAEDLGWKLTERKCHPENRLCLIAQSLISGWCSQERLIWHLCRSTQISPAFIFESFNHPFHSCFPHLALGDTDNWHHNWQAPAGLRNDSGPVCDMSLIFKTHLRTVRSFPNCFSNYSVRRIMTKKIW